MSDHPLIFSAPMIRAQIKDRKTMTRRLFTPATCTVLGRRVSAKSAIWRGLDFSRAVPRRQSTLAMAVHGEDAPEDVHLNVPFIHPDDESKEELIYRVRPIWEVGDRIWVRESLRADKMENILTGERTTNAEVIYYAADDSEALDSKGFNLAWIWARKALPSIHMPRWLSRLTLIIEGVKIERLQDISEEDAIAEGCVTGKITGHAWNTATEMRLGIGAEWACARDWYADLWDSLHGPDAWEANPWVAAIRFKVIKANIDAIKDTA